MMLLPDDMDIDTSMFQRLTTALNAEARLTAPVAEDSSVVSLPLCPPLLLLLGFADAAGSAGRPLGSASGCVSGWAVSGCAVGSSILFESLLSPSSVCEYSNDMRELLLILRYLGQDCLQTKAARVVVLRIRILSLYGDRY